VPELPEVETTRRGLAPHLVGQRIDDVVIRNPRLRWPIAPDFRSALVGKHIRTLRRRAKDLIIDLDQGAVIVHLGMSGALSLVPAAAPATGKCVHAAT